MSENKNTSTEGKDTPEKSEWEKIKEKATSANQSNQHTGGKADYKISFPVNVKRLAEESSLQDITSSTNSLIDHMSNIERFVERAISKKVEEIKNEALQKEVNREQQEVVKFFEQGDRAKYKDNKNVMNVMAPIYHQERNNMSISDALKYSFEKALKANDLYEDSSGIGSRSSDEFIVNPINTSDQNLSADDVQKINKDEPQTTDEAVRQSFEELLSSNPNLKRELQEVDSF